MPLNAAGVASSINSAYQDVISTNDVNTSLNLMKSAWQNAYHGDASASVNPIATGAGSAGVIGAAYAGLTGSVTNNVDVLAQMFADYWATSHLAPVPPCVSILGNDAATKVGAYKAAIMGVITTSESTPYFEALFVAVESVTKTIIWSGVTNLGAPLTGSVS